MAKVKIVKKNDDYSIEYEIGDILEVEGTWYGGVHVAGRTGVPVSLDREEYMELKETPETGGKAAEDMPDSAEKLPDAHGIRPGDVVRHFKREWSAENSSEYLYRVLTFAQHTETGELLVIYRALYAPYKTSARPYAICDVYERGGSPEVPGGEAEISF